MPLLLKPRLQEALDRGVPIAVVDATGLAVDLWIRSLADEYALPIDWAYRMYDKKKLPHVLYLGDERGRREAIGRLERNTLSLNGKLLLVAYDFAQGSWRQPIALVRGTANIIEDCTHSMWRGHHLDGWFCPGCGVLVFDPGC